MIERAGFNGVYSRVYPFIVCPNEGADLDHIGQTGSRPGRRVLSGIRGRGHSRFLIIIAGLSRLRAKG